MVDQTSISDNATLIGSVDETDHTQGPADAPVTLVQYGDYECPYCGRMYPIIRSIRKKMGPKLRFVFRNFPLKQMHSYAVRAAEAAEAAGAQGQFWEMHDHLYEHQNALEDDDLRGYADELGLDGDEFERSVFVEHRYEEQIRADFKSGIHSGVNGTPTFFINGSRYDGALSEDALLLSIENAM
ncbi:DsbA family protein [Halocatena marina]|uniref:DsbA family protein n=1 Tax=Halocatena marina TaxID=2934937 RepID=A0ABD5YWP9_9EURY|nr:DsbA family protein [Halocatena marina]